MKQEYEKQREKLVKKVENMSEKELRNLIADIYLNLQSAPVLIDFLSHKGIINRNELKEYCLNKLRGKE